MHVRGVRLGFTHVLGSEYTTIKYGTNGNRLWVARYAGPYDDAGASAIVLDAAGNVHVTGSSMGVDYSYDYVTIKYDTNGNQLWLARSNGPANENDSPTAITLDALDNSVYVTGTSVGAGPSDYATMKYDRDGNELWVARYNRPGNGDDWATAIVLDASRNVYVTGTSLGGATSYDYATVKYDAHGNELWVALYNGPGNSFDGANALTVDASGVYVTGRSLGAGTSADYATVKYDTDGNERWVARYNGPGNWYDVAAAIVLDVSGNVYVTGQSPGAVTSSDYATIKYDNDGNELWVARYEGRGNGDDYAAGIVLDASKQCIHNGVQLGRWHSIRLCDYQVLADFRARRS